VTTGNGSLNGRRRVVVTGLGAVTPLGLDVESTWSRLLAGDSGAAEITQFDHSDYKVHFACEVKDLDPTDWVDRKDARRMDRFTHLILAAARQAETDSGIDIAKEADRTGASIATGSTRSPSPRSSRTWAPAGSRSSSARVGRWGRSARRAPPRTWRSGTGSTRFGSAARM
jgi:3-oxoacyl-(acyl-carrier-protein) synthase